MQIHIFRGTGRVFGFTQDAVGANLPNKFGPWIAFKTLDMQSGQATPGVNVDECLEDIKRFGFHLTDAHVRITENI